jgi:hypothetical protein
MDINEFRQLAGRATKARGRTRHVPGQMNKTEEAYSNLLDLQYKAGEILWWGFEVIKLKLADKTYYTPDFAVMMPDGTFRFIEIKGFWEDDARVKIKCAAERFFMFDFVALKPREKKNGGGYDVENFSKGEVGGEVLPFPAA